jgi:hypothetical protein
VNLVLLLLPVVEVLPAPLPLHLLELTHGLRRKRNAITDITIIITTVMDIPTA